MNRFLENAQEIFEVARAGNIGENVDITLLVREDRVLHMIMDSGSSESDALTPGDRRDARMTYRVRRNNGEITVTGKSRDQDCVLENHCKKKSDQRNLLQDYALYLITSPVLISPAS